MYKGVKNAKELIEESKSRPIILFKESLTCPVSAKAKEEVDAFVAEGNPYPVFVLSVQEQKEVSDDIAEILKVRHETPQIILIQNGKAMDHLNHNDVTKEEIEDMIM